MIFLRQIILLFSFFFLLFIPLRSSDASKIDDQPTRITSMEVIYRMGDTRAPLKVTSMIRQETENVLASIHHLSGLSAHQLPHEYYHLWFANPVVLPHFSPIGHPVTDLIITPPKHTWDEYHLLVKNGQNQWIEYKTKRSLHILVNKIESWNTIK